MINVTVNGEKKAEKRWFPKLMISEDNNAIFFCPNKDNAFCISEGDSSYNLGERIPGKGSACSDLSDFTGTITLRNEP